MRTKNVLKQVKNTLVLLLIVVTFFSNFSFVYGQKTGLDEPPTTNTNPVPNTSISPSPRPTLTQEQEKIASQAAGAIRDAVAAAIKKMAINHVERSIQIMMNSLKNSNQNNEDDDNDTGETTSPEDIDINFDQWGLPPPIAEDNKAYVNGEIVDKANTPGYTSLRKKITPGSKHEIAIKQLLAAEKKLGGKTIPYLTTTWIWFENDFGGAIPPDLYQINCHDNRALQNVGIHCKNSFSHPGDRNNMLQIAGYQAYDRAVFNDYIKVLNQCYGSNPNIPTILRKVYNNSINAHSANRSYIAQKDVGLVKKYYSSIDSATLNDIARNSVELSIDERKHFFTLMLGKDPCMVIGLNTSNVSSGDLIRCIKNESCGWARYVRERKQHLSNMVAALYLFDQGKLPGENNEDDNEPPIVGGPAIGCENAGASINVPGTRKSLVRLRGKCMKPTMLVVHWTGSWNSAEQTVDILNDRELSCHFATDHNKQIQMLNFHDRMVEQSACVLGYNASSISNEISGVNFDSVYANSGAPKNRELLAATAKALQSSCWAMKKYNIPMSQVYGHYELTDGKPDPGAKYLAYFKNRLRPMLNNNCREGQPVD